MSASRSDPFKEGEAAAAARRRRSLAIALLCVLFAVLVFSVTAVRLTQNVAAQRSSPAAEAPR